MLLQELKKINGTVTQSELDAVLSDISKSESDIHSSEYQLVINRILKARPGSITPTSQSQPPAKPAQAPGGGLAKPPAPAANAGLATAQSSTRSAAQVKRAQEDKAFEMFAAPVDATTRVMARGLELAQEKLDALVEQNAAEVAEDIVAAVGKSVGELRTSSAAWSGRVTTQSMATFNMDDMETIDVPVM